MSSSGERLESATVNELERSAAVNLRTVDTKSEAFRELVSSVKTHGILEPVLARREKGRLILVAGFRRVAAAKASGQRYVPVRVLDLASSGVIEVQLLENLQREDLTPLQEARAMKSYLESTKLTQEQLGKKIGKSQSYVANRIRLLNLSDAGMKLVESGKISASAAEQLVAFPSEAARETKRAIDELREASAYGRAVTVEKVREVVDNARRSFQDRSVREKALAAAKFPNCPVKGCGKRGLYRQWSTELRDSAGHEWDPKSGRVTDHGRSSARSEDLRPPPPKLPLVDPVVPIAVDVDVLARRVLEAMKDVKELDLEWVSGTTGRLTVYVEIPTLRAAKVPAFSVRKGQKSVRLWSAESWDQQDDRGRQRVAKERAELESWLGTVRGAGRPARRDPPGNPPTSDRAPPSTTPPAEPPATVPPA